MESSEWSLDSSLESNVVVVGHHITQDSLEYLVHKILTFPEYGPQEKMSTLLLCPTIQDNKEHLDSYGRNAWNKKTEEQGPRQEVANSPNLA